MGSSNALNNARKKKNDEFYTRIEDIEKTMPKIKKELEDKTVLLPCDHSKRSMFYKYLKDNFKKYKLKKLIAVTYEGFMCEYDGEDETITPFDGDILHEDINKLIDSADIIITNPPFSLFGVFFNKIKHKQFLIIAPLTSLNRIEVFELIKEGKCFANNNVTKFKNPNGIIISSPCIWLTNLYKELVGNMEPKKLDEYEVYNFNHVIDALLDHTYEYKAVPITYLQKHDPERFEIIKLIKDAKLKGKKIFTRVLIRDKEVLDK